MVYWVTNPTKNRPCIILIKKHSPKTYMKSDLGQSLFHYKHLGVDVMREPDLSKSCLSPTPTPFKHTIEVKFNFNNIFVLLVSFLCLVVMWCVSFNCQSAHCDIVVMWKCCGWGLLSRLMFVSHSAYSCKMACSLVVLVNCIKLYVCAQAA